MVAARAYLDDAISSGAPTLVPRAHLALGNLLAHNAHYVEARDAYELAIQSGDEFATPRAKEALAKLRNE